jgi:hypothetical protein
MHTPRAEDDRPTRPFADFLREQAKGATHAELSEAMQTLVDAVLDTGKNGTIVLTIKVEPMKGDRRAVYVSDAIKIKLPEHDRDASLFFADKDNNLRRDDPGQGVLPGLVAVVEPETIDLPKAGRSPPRPAKSPTDPANAQPSTAPTKGTP